MAFTLTPDEAQAWREEERRYRGGSFSFLSGADLNSRSDRSARRWVIDFDDMPEARAREYHRPYQRLLDRVKPERQRRKRDGTFVLRRPLPQRWWQFQERRTSMRSAIAGLDDILVVARISKVVMPLRIRTGCVPSDMVVVFATDSFA